MKVTKSKSTEEKRAIPFDQPIKIVLLFLHVIGFSVWYGGMVIKGQISAIFPAMTVFSGMFLVARELYKDGFVWLVKIEGVLTEVKVMLLAAASTSIKYEVPLLSVVIMCGLLSSHLPEKVRERRIVQL